MGILAGRLLLVTTAAGQRIDAVISDREDGQKQRRAIAKTPDDRPAFSHIIGGDGVQQEHHRDRRLNSRFHAFEQAIANH